MAEACGTSGTKKSSRREAVNFGVLLILFIIYALTFTIAKFYDMINIVYPYAGVINFAMLGVLFLNNVVFAEGGGILRSNGKGRGYDTASGKEKNSARSSGNILNIKKGDIAEIIILGAILFVAGINLFIVNSGKGAFFVPANFIMIWYLSDKLSFSAKQLKILAGIYMGYLLFYFFIAYPRLFTTFENYKYNTNTAATFMIYTLLCAFILLEMFVNSSPIVGLFMTAILLKGFQMSLWHRARGAFVMLIVFMVFRFLVPKKWWSSKPFYVILSVLATLGSLMFVGLYVLVGTTGANFKLPFFYKEVFSGREAIWQELFGLLVNKDRPYMLFTGIGTNFELESFFEKNVHNAMYNFVVIHGIIVFTGILYFVFKRLQGFRKNVIGNHVAACAMCAIMAVFFESYFDVDLIWADYALNLIFLLCVVNNSARTETFKI